MLTLGHVPLLEPDRTQGKNRHHQRRIQGEYHTGWMACLNDERRKLPGGNEPCPIQQESTPLHLLPIIFR